MSGFLDLPPDRQDAGRARVHVLPAPLEETVSYEGGTAAGPAAIIAASGQVELYDGELGGEPALEYGIHTLPPVGLAAGDVAASLAAIERGVAAVLRAGKLPVVLGGEHTVSVGAVRAVAAAGRLGERGAVVQIDAHADLRSEYQGTKWSHACVMRRIFEETDCDLYSIGVRSMSADEASFTEANHDRIHPLQPYRLTSLSTELLGRPVYLTIDVDGLDPSVVPATGTPEPGGLYWQETVALLGAVCSAGRVVGIDCVELAPRPGLHMADFAVAKLLYWTISRAVRGPMAA
jgi:agmatinase